jgi:hypothetical protein
MVPVSFSNIQDFNLRSSGRNLAKKAFEKG